MELATLWLINGLGLGNSTRCLAVMQHLPGRHAVATSGNGLDFFRGRPEVDQLFELEGLGYGASTTGGIGLGGTLKGLLAYPPKLRRNRLALAAMLERVRPRLLVCDSYYGPFTGYRGKRAAINNSDRISRAFFSTAGKPLSIYAHFFGVELLDCLWHRLLPAQRVSPWFFPSLVCRREIQESGPRPLERILVMLSGSGLGPPLDPARWRLEHNIDVIGCRGRSHDSIHYHGKLMHNTDLLNQADVLVVHAGFSAISEAMAMRKPFVAVPLPGHAEQWLNARFVEQLGVGRMACRPEQVLPQLQTLLSRPEEVRRAYARLELRNDGAALIAGSLLSDPSRP